MAKSKNSAKETPSSPLLNRLEIQHKLELVLAELKPAFGEKKFRRRMKKAGKLISNGLPKKANAGKSQPASVASATVEN